MRGVRIAISGKSPCDQCHSANCCRFQCVGHHHNHGTTPGEHGRFLKLNPGIPAPLDRQ